MKRLILLLVFAATCIASIAAAEEYQWNDFRHRMSLGVGLDRIFHGNWDTSTLIEPKNEWGAGIYAAYNIVPALDLTASTIYGFDSQEIVSKVGIRLTLIAPPEAPPVQP